MTISNRPSFGWQTEADEESHAYLVPAVLNLLSQNSLDGSIVDLGCGNGALSDAISRATGRPMVGLDADVEGIRIAQARKRTSTEFLRADLSLRLDDSLQGQFSTALSIEVIEHLLIPGSIFERASEAGATEIIISTPYHGYWKNLALALTNGFDSHWHPQRDLGHVKFFSRSTLNDLADRYGWRQAAFARVGRPVSALAKSMVLLYERQM